MNTDRRRAVAALTAAGLLWGTTVPLSKLALDGGAPGGLGGLRGVAGRRRPGRRRRRGQRDGRRRWPGAGVAAAVGRVHGGADPAAARPRPGRGDRGAVPGGGARRAAALG